LPILTEKDKAWEAKHSPKLTIRAKYEPYDALRQRFWRQYITQYDVDETGTMSFPELTAMLDSLGSTLTQGTIEGFFKSSGKDIEGELTIEEVILHLENEATKPAAQKAKVKPISSQLNSGTHTPSMAPEPQGDGLAVDGPQQVISSPVDADELREKILRSQRQTGDLPGNLEAMDGNVPDIRVREPSLDGKETPLVHNGRAPRGGADLGADTMETMSPSADVEGDLDVSDDGDNYPSDADTRERVINIRTCPLCHQARLNKRSEQDIVTHLAVCASNDWARVDRIVTANYVTSSQAQRKFLTRMVNKVTIGNYRLGANSANILVQDRLTGQLQEEKMAVYVRLGIRVLYKGWRNKMEGGRGESCFWMSIIELIL
jgi:phosphatidylserine decarboxylase